MQVQQVVSVTKNFYINVWSEFYIVHSDLSHFLVQWHFASNFPFLIVENVAFMLGRVRSSNRVFRTHIRKFVNSNSHHQIQIQIGIQIGVSLWLCSSIQNSRSQFHQLKFTSSNSKAKSHLHCCVFSLIVSHFSYFLHLVFSILYFLLCTCCCICIFHILIAICFQIDK